MSESPTTDAAVAAMLGEGDEPPESTEGTEAPEEIEGQEPTAIEELPDWAQEEIRKLRRESANARVKARQAGRKAPASEQPTEASQQALKAAEERGRQAARLENGIRLARAEAKAALTGVVVEDQIDDVIDDLDLSRFVEDNGDVDSEAVKAFRDKFTNLVGKRSTPHVSHGRQTRATPSTSTADAFAKAVEGAFQ